MASGSSCFQACRILYTLKTNMTCCKITQSSTGLIILKWLVFQRVILVFQQGKTWIFRKPSPRSCTQQIQPQIQENPFLGCWEHVAIIVTLQGTDTYPGQSSTQTYLGWGYVSSQEGIHLCMCMYIYIYMWGHKT